MKINLNTKDLALFLKIIKKHNFNKYYIPYKNY